MDRFSSLPDEIVSHTLSFLPTKEAATTSILSKRWRNLFAFTQNLCFEDKDLDYHDGDFPRSFTVFLDRVLFISGNSPLKKFSLEYGYLVDDLAHINNWICNVISRGALSYLNIDIICRGVASLPLEVFTCKTLVKLKLKKGFNIRMVPENASFPALKSISLDSIRFHNRTFEALISVCHVLEELHIIGRSSEDLKWCHTVSCTTLQRLTISDLHGSVMTSLTLDTPSLAYLKYFGCVPREYGIVNNLDSLVEANIRFIEPILPSCNPTNLIKSLRNVKILNLTSQTSEVFYRFSEAIPVLENLSRLSIDVGNMFWRLPSVLLRRSPNLETLVIDDLYLGCIDYGVCQCESSCPVKVIEMTNFRGTVRKIAQLKHFLEKFPCLELLKVSPRGKREKTKLQLATDLLLSPTAFKIQLE